MHAVHLFIHQFSSFPSVDLSCSSQLHAEYSGTHILWSVDICSRRVKPAACPLCVSRSFWGCRNHRVRFNKCIFFVSGSDHQTSGEVAQSSSFHQQEADHQRGDPREGERTSSSSSSSSSYCSLLYSFNIRVQFRPHPWGQRLALRNSQALFIQIQTSNSSNKKQIIFHL